MHSHSRWDNRIFQPQVSGLNLKLNIKCISHYFSEIIKCPCTVNFSFCLPLTCVLLTYLDCASNPLTFFVPSSCRSLSLSSFCFCSCSFLLPSSFGLEVFGVSRSRGESWGLWVESSVHQHLPSGPRSNTFTLKSKSLSTLAPEPDRLLKNAFLLHYSHLLIYCFF